MKNKLKKIVLKPMDLLYKIAPRFEVKLMFFLKNGHFLNERKPRTFNEKLNWMKIHYRNPNMIKCADKYKVREYIESKEFGKYLPKLLWNGYDPNEIPFELLPEKFVIKVTHGAGNNIICTNKSKLNKKKSIKLLTKWLKEDYLISYGEWFYGQVKPRIIIEEFLSNDGYNSPHDYKVYCFNNINGVQDVGFIGVYERYNNKLKKSLYSKDWEPIDVAFGTEPAIEKRIEKPKLINEIIHAATLLSKEFPHARVDFYIVENKIYIGEITFMTGAGYNKIRPKEFDEKLGNWIRLPKD